MKGKKIFAAVLAAAMAFGSTLTAFAAQQGEIPQDKDTGALTGSDIKEETGEIEGTGGVEGSVDKNIFHVVLPTQTSDLLKSSLNFKLDPQKLITATSGSAITASGGTYETGKTLYFPNYQGPNPTTGSAIHWADTSSKITVTNKGSMAVDISASATLSNLGKIEISNDDQFTGDTSTSMYMEIVAEGQAADIKHALAKTKDTDSEASASIDTKTLDAVAESNFEVTETNGSYTYALKQGVADTEFKSFSFWLKGASNTAGDWEKLGAVKPSLKVTWKVKPHTDSYLDKSAISAADSTVTPTLPNGVTLDLIQLVWNGNTTQMTSQHFTKSNGSFTFIPAKVGAWTGGTLVFTYSDGHVDQVTIQ